MKAKKMKEMKKKFFAVHPKYSQMDLRAMGRRRTARPITPLTARVKRQQEFWDFVDKEDRKAKQKLHK